MFFLRENRSNNIIDFESITETINNECLSSIQMEVDINKILLDSMYNEGLILTEEPEVGSNSNQDQSKMRKFIDNVKKFFEGIIEAMKEGIKNISKFISESIGNITNRFEKIHSYIRVNGELIKKGIEELDDDTLKIKNNIAASKILESVTLESDVEKSEQAINNIQEKLKEASEKSKEEINITYEIMLSESKRIDSEARKYKDSYRAVSQTMGRALNYAAQARGETLATSSNVQEFKDNIAEYKEEVTRYNKLASANRKLKNTKVRYDNTAMKSLMSIAKKALSKANKKSKSNSSQD